MKTLMLTMLAALSLPISTAYAQNGMHMMPGGGPGGWGMGCPYCQDFDAKNTETVSGTVEKAEVLTPARGMAQGVHLLLKTGKETISVHLGPQWFIDNQETSIKAGDKVQVTGVRTKVDGQPAVIAYEVVKGDSVLTLRDADGRPVWAGWRGRHMGRGM